MIEPWPVLGATAQTTTSLTIGTRVTPVARRRPRQLAREVITLDHLSRGRVMLGIGLGSPDEDFTPFWPHPSSARAPTPRELEAAEHRERWRRFHDSLQLLDQLLRGATVDRDDALFTARNVSLRPRPNRTIPILVGGRATTMRALHLAAEHAGGVPIAFDRESRGQPSLQQVRTYAKTIRQAAAPRTPLVAIWAHTDGRPPAGRHQALHRRRRRLVDRDRARRRRNRRPAQHDRLPQAAHHRRPGRELTRCALEPVR